MDVGTLRMGGREMTEEDKSALDKAKVRAGDAVDKAKDVTGELVEKAKPLVDRAGEVAGSLLDKAKEKLASDKTDDGATTGADDQTDA